jgi:metallophosphoesterase superfamily enzyme
MVMPAFGAYAGGLDLWDRAISSLFAGDFGAYMLGARRVYAVAGRGIPQSMRRKASDDSQPSTMDISTIEIP